MDRKRLVADIKSAFDVMSRNYLQSVVNDFSMVLMRQRVWKILEQLVRPSTVILDLGCGIGIDAVFMARNGCRVVGIDISEGMVSKANFIAKRFQMEDSVQFHVCEIERIHKLKPLDDVRFDGTLANFGTLNTTPNLKSTGELLSEKLKAGGWLVATVMGSGSLWHRIAQILMPSVVQVDRHRKPAILKENGFSIPTYFWTPQEFENAFNTFTTVRLEALGLFYPPPGLMNRLQFLKPIWRALAKLEPNLSSSLHLGGLGDHFLIVMRKK